MNRPRALASVSAAPAIAARPPGLGPAGRERPPRRPAPARRAIAFVLAGAVLLGGCVGLPPADLKEPEIEIVDLSLTDIGFEKVRFRILLEASNPNAVDLPLSNLRMDLRLFDLPLGEAKMRDDRFTLPGRSTTRLPVDFTVPTVRLLDLGLKLKAGGLANPGYRLEGSADWGDTRYAIPLRKQGNLDLIKRIGELLGQT